MEKLLYILGSAVCHQLPERSFFLGGHQLPVCMRCSGTYLGAIITFLYFLVTGRLKRGRFPQTPIFLTILAFPFVMGIDVVTVNLGLRSANGDIKLLTGVFAGFFITSFLVPAFHTGFSGKYQDKEIFTNYWFILLIPLFYLITFFLTHLDSIIMFYVTAILQNLSILGIFTVLNTFIFLTIFDKKFEFPVSYKSLLKIPIPSMFLFTIIELGTIYLIRVNYLPVPA